MDIISMILARNQSNGGLPVLELSEETTAKITTNVGVGAALNEEEAAFFRKALDENTPVCVKISAEGMKISGIFESHVDFNNEGEFIIGLCYDATAFTFMVLEIDGVMTITMSLGS